MIGYTTIGVKDLDKAKKFYCDLFADQNAKVLVDVGRLAMIGSSMAEPKIAVCVPFNEENPHPGNGVMVAFPAKSKADADAMYHKAMSLGATDEGEPGQRIEDQFYGGYVRDPDGNKLCFFVFG